MSKKKSNEVSIGTTGESKAKGAPVENKRCRVAKGRVLFCLRGKLPAGTEVEARDFHGGQKIMVQNVENGGLEWFDPEEKKSK